MKCGACSKSVTGTLWQCAECTGPTGRLCSSCYHRGKHSVDHNFVRKADKESPGCAECWAHAVGSFIRKEIKINIEV